jgi:hypothetical protein
MFYLQEALSNLLPVNFYELPLAAQHRTLDSFERTLVQFPYLVKLPELHSRLAQLWRLEITRPILDDLLRIKIEDLLIETQALMAAAGLNPLVVVVSTPGQGLEFPAGLHPAYCREY